MYDAKYLRSERLEVAGKSFGESAEYPIFLGGFRKVGPKSRYNWGDITPISRIRTPGKPIYFRPFIMVLTFWGPLCGCDSTNQSGESLEL